MTYCPRFFFLSACLITLFIAVNAACAAPPEPANKSISSSPAPDAGNRINILDFGTSATPVDRTGTNDASTALASAVNAANAYTSRGQPACVYLPSGIYKIVTPPPPFLRAGCVKGEGSSQSIIDIDPHFAGDLFAWSEAWEPTTPGPTIMGLQIRENPKATPAALQNAFVFYDRNDEVFMEDVTVKGLHGRALYAGVMKNMPQAYMRESHMISLRFFNDGAPGVPTVELTSQGTGQVDGTNEITMSMIDIYGARGPSFVIRNESSGSVRGIKLDTLRIEGLEQKVFGPSQGDLLTIGDPHMTGTVAGITLTDAELVDPSQGYCALRMTAPQGSPAPYLIDMHGMIGGGMPNGKGLCIDAGRTSTFRLSNIHTLDTNVVIGRGVGQILIDGGGLEPSWTYSIDPASTKGINFPTTYKPFGGQ